MLRSRSPMVRKTDKITSFITVLWRYVIFSCLFWMSLSVFLLILLYESSYGEKSRMYFFSSFSLALQFITIITSILIFSAILGGILSFPAIILKILMKIQVDKKSRKGQRPTLLIFSSTYIPILFCIYIHLFALIINTSAAPQMMRKWFEKNSSIYDIQEQFYNKIYEIKKTEIYTKWNYLGKNSNKNAKFIFILPDHLLAYNNSFRETKLLLKKENNWFLYSPTKLSISASLLGEGNSADERLFSPVPIQLFSHISQNQDLLKNRKNLNRFYIGVNGKNSLNFPQIFPKNSLSNNISSTWLSIFLNRVAMSQPQLLFFFRIGLGGFFFSSWKWENLVNINSYLLSSYLENISGNKNNINNFLFFLSEMENNKENTFLKNIDWPEDISKKEFENNIDKIDYYLSFAIKGLQDAGQENILVIPYNQQYNSLSQGKGYSNIINQEIFLTPEIVYQKFVAKFPNTSCSTMLLNFNIISKNQSIHNKNYFLMDTINSKRDSFPIVKKDFNLGVKEEIKYAVFCQNEKKSSYIILRKEGIFNKGNYVNKLSYKNIHNQIFLSFENKSKKYEGEKLLASRSSKIFEKAPQSQENNLIDFYKQFDIYKISIDNLQTFNPLNDIEKDQFIRKYGTEVKNKFYSYIQYSIK